MKKFLSASWAIIQAIYAIVGLMLIMPIAILLAMYEIAVEKFKRKNETFEEKETLN
jgi:uncharacterized membrane protein YuzA (DUF378 family)